MGGRSEAGIKIYVNYAIKCITLLSLLCGGAALLLLNFMTSLVSKNVKIFCLLGPLKLFAWGALYAFVAAGLACASQWSYNRAIEIVSLEVAKNFSKIIKIGDTTEEEKGSRAKESFVNLGHFLLVFAIAFVIWGAIDYKNAVLQIADVISKLNL